MIKVIIKYKDFNIFSSLSIKGHAESGPYGQDLVCAGVSAIVLGGINNLTDKDYLINTDEENGNVEIVHLGKISNHDQIVIDTIIVQLKAIEQSYPKNIKISD